MPQNAAAEGLLLHKVDGCSDGFGIIYTVDRRASMGKDMVYIIQKDRNLEFTKQHPEHHCPVTNLNQLQNKIILGIVDGTYPFEVYNCMDLMNSDTVELNLGKPFGPAYVQLFLTDKGSYELCSGYEGNSSKYHLRESEVSEEYITAATAYLGRVKERVVA
jgi:hypothetical protein